MQIDLDCFTNWLKYDQFFLFDADYCRFRYRFLFQMAIIDDKTISNRPWMKFDEIFQMNNCDL